MSKERKFCAVDAEGDVGGRGLLGVAFYSPTTHSYLTTPEYIVQMLEDHAREGYTFLCHNASYDIPVVWGQLGLEPEYTYYNGRLHHGSWKWKRGQPAAQIWDTLDLSGGLSLAELGKAMGIPKYPTPQKLLGKDPDKFDWKCETHDRWECEECYAVRDAEICYRFMEGLSHTLAGWGCGTGPRIAGVSVDVWRVLDHPAKIGLGDAATRRLARSSYYGGRVECFIYGRLPACYVADIQSMYPAVMLSTPFPDPERMVYLGSISASSLPLDCEGVAEVDISIPLCHVPPLPYTRKGDRIYPVGRLVGVWTLLELRHAIALGATVNRVVRVAYATSNLYPFTQFIGTLWALREAYKASNDPRQLFAKLLMNNLYGRLGARDKPERMIIRPVPKGFSTWRSKPFQDTARMGDRTYLIQTDEMSFGRDWTNVLWAAQITSAARVKLHKLMLLQGPHLAYCDTDSIFSTQPIQGCGEGLGELKMEGQFQSAIICQPKLYALQDFDGHWQPKGKGVPREQALRYLSGHEVHYQKPVKPREGLRRGIEPGTWIAVDKIRRSTTMRRQPRNPVALSDAFGLSETDPFVNGPLTDYRFP